LDIFLAFSLSNLEGEQPLRPQHQDADDRQQRDHLGHRAGGEELQRRARLGDGEGGRKLDAEGMVDLIESFCKQYPLVSVEDGLDENDFSGFGKLDCSITPL